MYLSMVMSYLFQYNGKLPRNRPGLRELLVTGKTLRWKGLPLRRTLYPQSLLETIIKYKKIPNEKTRQIPKPLYFGNTFNDF